MGTLCIVGGSGFVGGHLLNRWSGQHTIKILSRHGDGSALARVAPGSRHYAIDVYDPDMLAHHFAGADAVVNLVGILNEKGNDGSGFERAHVTLTETVIDACRRAEVSRLLQMSSLKAGEGESHYLISKGKAEARVRDSGLDWTILRPSTIFGPGDSFLLRFASLLKMVPLFMPLACPNARMQPVYVADVAAAFDRALTDRRAFGQTWELGGPEVMTLKEIVAYLRDLLGLRRTIIGLPDGIARLQASVFDLVPGKPFSSDNFRSLQSDSVTDDNALPKLGITPTPMNAVVPRYLGNRTRADRLQDFRVDHRT
ncbi:MAG: complex I NDUFA9 subunit family protein [Pseudomonadota bacterium]